MNSGVIFPAHSPGGQVQRFGNFPVCEAAQNLEGDNLPGNPVQRLHKLPVCLQIQELIQLRAGIGNIRPEFRAGSRFPVLFAQDAQRLVLVIT